MAIEKYEIYRNGWNEHRFVPTGKTMKIVKKSYNGDYISTKFYRENIRNYKLFGFIPMSVKHWVDVLDIEKVEKEING